MRGADESRVQGVEGVIVGDEEQDCPQQPDHPKTLS